MRNNVGKKEPVNPIPDGIWESSIPNQKESNKSTTKHDEELRTDLQKNGYPPKNK